MNKLIWYLLQSIQCYCSQKMQDFLFEDSSQERLFWQCLEQHVNIMQKHLAMCSRHSSLKWSVWREIRQRFMNYILCRPKFETWTRPVPTCGWILVFFISSINDCKFSKLMQSIGNTLSLSVFPLDIVYLCSTHDTTDWHCQREEVKLLNKVHLKITKPGYPGSLVVVTHTT